MLGTISTVCKLYTKHNIWDISIYLNIIKILHKESVNFGKLHKGEREVCPSFCLSLANQAGW